jgi:hypothetical protein
MGNLSGVEALHATIAERLPEAHVTVEAPPQPNGSWWIDIHYAGKTASVEWRPGRGFGVAGADASYGEGPERVFDDPSAAANHAISQLVDATALSGTVAEAKH